MFYSSKTRLKPLIPIVKESTKLTDLQEEVITSFVTPVNLLNTKEIGHSELMETLVHYHQTQLMNMVPYIVKARNIANMLIIQLLHLFLFTNLIHSEFISELRAYLNIPKYSMLPTSQKIKSLLLNTTMDKKYLDIVPTD